MKICPLCDTPFEPNTIRQQYCSVQCSKRDWARKATIRGRQVHKKPVGSSPIAQQLKREIDDKFAELSDAAEDSLNAQIAALERKLSGSGEVV